MYYPSQSQATPLTVVRRKRVLPVPGQVLVEIGDRVDPQQIVAEAALPGEFRIVPVARLLSVSPRRAARMMRVKPGDAVEAGQVIAMRRGLSRLAVRSPIAGRVTASGAGRVLIEADSPTLQLPANLYGEVAAVIEGLGAVIVSRGAVVQGVWGNGAEGFGVLRCLVKSPDEPLLAKMVDASCHGAVLVGGAGLEEGVFERAAEMDVRGIVLGGLPAALLARARQTRCAIVATEGIGALPMATPLFRILSTNDGREAAVNGSMRLRAGVVRPEVIVPLPAEATSTSSTTEIGAPLAVGMRVRIVRAPHLGATGTVAALPPRARSIETGARVRGAEVDIGLEAPVFVPLANLEVLY